MKFHGKTFLLRLGDGASSETFETVAAQRSTALTIGGETIDVSTKEIIWRELIEGGVRDLSFTASGLIVDRASFAELAAIAHTGAIRNYEMVFRNGDTIRGAMQITSHELTGEYASLQQYTLTLSGSVIGEIEPPAIQEGRLMLRENNDPLLLTEGGNPVLLIEASEPIVPDKTARELEAA